jgi:sec-independent protein translocase protein TatA
MFANLNGWHAVIIIAVILLLFGAPKIPQLARSLGQSMKILKTEIREDPKSTASVTTEEPAPAAPVAGQSVGEAVAR